MFVVTGIARSGTSYTCALLNAIPAVFCLHEQMTDFMLSVSDRNDLGRVFYADKVNGFLLRHIGNAGLDPGSLSGIGMKIPFPDLSLTHIMQMQNMRFLALIRHPVDLFLSQYQRDMDGSPWPREIFLRDGGLYKYHIYNNYCNLLDNINPSRLLCLKYEHLATDPGLLRLVGEFLGLPAPLSPGQCAASAQAVAGFGRKPAGVICPARGCLDNRRIYDESLVAYFTQLAAQFCQEAMARFGYVL